MKTIITTMILSLMLISTNVFAQETDCKIPSYINQLDGFTVESCQFSEFNEYQFTFNNLKGDYTEASHSGVFYRINYEIKEESTRKVSGAQIRQNYYNAVIKSKGENLSSDKNMFKFSVDRKTVWMLVDNAWDDDDKGFQIYIIEEAAINQEIEIYIKEALQTEGKIALYGIFFDVDKSVIKSESEPELSKLTEYLKTNSAAKIYVVGHTDGSGDFVHNLTLSKDRAKSVVDYLVSKGIDLKRLTSDGVGPLCPVSTNQTEAGKKKNRRVEIVLR